MSPAEGFDENRLRRACLQELESLRRAGVTHLPKPRAVPESVATDVVEVQPPPAAPPVVPLPPKNRELDLAGATAPRADDSLEIVAREVAGCTLCAELARTRTKTVPGVGNPRARLLFLGEAPGADEDRQGEPFVGRAGQLLTQIIENGMGLKRGDVFIANVLKCRPPGNRTPAPEEAANCRGFLDRQLALIRPEFVCCLGAVAAQNLLGTDRPIGRLRGQFFDYRGSRVMCTYHPAYLLRNPAAKKDTWADIQMLMEAMGMSVPERSQRT